MRHSRPLLLEQLEDRCVPVTWGNPWPDALHLTVSFAPDGTNVAGHASVLFQEMNGQAPVSVWEKEILRALQTWAVQGNINLGVVGDDGSALGASGRPQGDSRFGDIRISMIEMSPDVIAISSPFDITNGTWSGDIRLNSRYVFGLNGSGDFDLYTVVLHESAHVFGIDHSADATSAVFEHYLTRNTYGLIASDIADLQALYGARGNDPFEGATGNNTRTTASALNLLRNDDGNLGIAAEGDLKTSQDVDWYRFQAPLNLGGFDVVVKTAGISQVAARLTVYDASGKVIGTSAATEPNSGNLRVRVNTLLPLLNTYYVKVEAARSDLFGVGSYRLQVGNLPLVQALTGVVQGTTQTLTGLLNDDFHTNDTFLTSLLLGATVTQADSRFDYGFKGSIRDGRDVDFYRITAPQATSVNSTMTVMVWGLDNNGLKPRVSVYNAQRQLVEAEVIVNDAGVFTVQIRNARAGANYYVKVEAAESQAPANVGNYFLGVDFRQQAVELDTLVDRTLSGARPQEMGVLTVQETEQLHLVLAAETSKRAAAVELTIFDASGKVIATRTATSGEDAVSLNVTLNRGTYFIRFRALAVDGTVLPDVHYLLRGTRASDPIGPGTEDTTTRPAGSPSPYNPPPSQPSNPPSNPPATSPSGGSTSPSSGSTTSPPRSSSPSSTTYMQPAPPPDSPPQYYYYDYSYYYYGSPSYGTADPYSPYSTQPYYPPTYQEPAGDPYRTT